MRAAAFGVLFAVIALSSALDAATPAQFNGAYNYHRAVGIPQAERIRQNEASILAGRNERIVGGSIGSIYNAPFQVGLIMTILVIFSSVCGGSLISDNKILTAAHCYTDGAITASSTTAVLGSSFLFTGGVRPTVSSVTLAPGYNPAIFANDVAIFHIAPVTFSLSISPIALPSGSELTQDFAGWVATASGYGVTEDGGSVGLLASLHTVNLQVITNAECQAIYGSVVVQDNIMCTSGVGGVGTCDGDSGGPLTVLNNGRRVLIGISSFTAAAGCQVGLPAGHTRVNDFINWIYSVA